MTLTGITPTLPTVITIQQVFKTKVLHPVDMILAAALTLAPLMSRSGTVFPSKPDCHRLPIMTAAGPGSQVFSTTRLRVAHKRLRTTYKE